MLLNFNIHLHRKMCNRYLLSKFAALCLLTLGDAPSIAAMHDLDHQLEQQAQAHVLAHLHHILPPQVREQAHIQVQISGPRGAAQNHCPGGWQLQPLSTEQWLRIHIPLSCAGSTGSVVARLHIQAPVYATTQALAKLHVLRQQDLQMQIAQIGSPNEVVTLEQLLGMQLRRATAQGQVLQAQHVSAPLYAKKGERLDIQAQAGSITVSTAGIALRNGSKGERIRARNIHSQTWVEGVLIAPGVLQAERIQPGRSVKVQSSD